VSDTNIGSAHLHVTLTNRQHGLLIGRELEECIAADRIIGRNRYKPAENEMEK